MISCRFKNCDVNDESKVQLHHIIPKCIGGTDKDGRIYLCKKHHEVLHNYLPKILYKYIPDSKKKATQKEIRGFVEAMTEKNKVK